MSQNEDGTLLVPEGKAGVCVCVQNWSHHHCVTVASGSEGWNALDEELSNSEWELPSHVPPTVNAVLMYMVGRYEKHIHLGNMHL